MKMHTVQLKTTFSMWSLLFISHLNERKYSEWTSESNKVKQWVEIKLGNVFFHWKSEQNDTKTMASPNKMPGFFFPPEVWGGNNFRHPNIWSKPQTDFSKYNMPPLIHDALPWLSKCREMDSSHRDDLTFNSNQALPRNALTYCMHKNQSFLRRKDTFFPSGTLNTSKDWHSCRLNKTEWIDLIIFGERLDQSHSFPLSEWGRSALEGRGIQSFEAGGARHLPGPEGSHFNTPLWAVLTANNINSSQRTHCYIQTQCIGVCIK